MTAGPPELEQETIAVRILRCDTSHCFHNHCGVTLLACQNDGIILAGIGVAVTDHVIRFLQIQTAQTVVWCRVFYGYSVCCCSGHRFVFATSGIHSR